MVVFETLPKWRVHMRCCAPVILREAIAQYGGNIDGVPGYEDALETTPICKHPSKAEAHDLVLSILGIPSSSGGRAATKAIGVTTKKKVEVSAKKKASKKVGVTANVGCQK